MIDSIEGKIIAIADQHIVIRPNSSGFSLMVSVPNSTLFKKNDVLELKIYMHWSQEQGPHLFGFVTEKERQVFLLIISCSGIGPKIGLAALNHLSPNAFIAALLQGDIKTLSKISGIGTRKAETLIVSLKNKASELVKDGFELRVLECPQCSKIIYHPGDLKEYDDFKRLKQRDFNVKLRMVGNSFCVSIPKELVDFHREFEREFNDLIRLSLEGRGKIGLFFIRRKDL